MAIKSKLWDHQQDAFGFAINRSATLLQCGMGTGKSLIALKLLEHWDAQRVLVIAPLAVCPVWQMEAMKHGFDGTVLDLSEGQLPKLSERLKKAHVRESGRLVVLVNYERFWRDSLWPTLHAIGWDVVVLDEAHRVKSPFGVASKHARELRASRRLALTGTPMPHSPLDIWGLFAFLDACVFGWSYVNFRATYAIVVKINNAPVVKGYRNLELLAKKIAGHTFQVDRSVLKLTEPVHTVIPVRLSAKSLKLYRKFESYAYAEIESGVISTSNALVKTLRLQQMTSGFVSTEADFDGESYPERLGEDKEDALIELLSDLEDSEKVVVFCRFVEDLRAVERAAMKCDKPRACMLQAGEAKQWREWSAREDGAVLACQWKSAMEGIDLTAARICVMFSEVYSLGDFEQAIARVHRPGQTRLVNYYYLVATGTIDEDVRKSREDKKNLVDSVIAGIKKRKGLAQAEDEG